MNRPRRSIVHLSWVSEGQEREMGKMMAKNFPEQMKGNTPRILEALWILGRINKKKSTPIHIIVKVKKKKNKDKEDYVNDPN